MFTKNCSNIVFNLFSLFILVAVVFAAVWSPNNRVSAQDSLEATVTATPTIEPTIETTPSVENTPLPESTATPIFTSTPEVIVTSTVTATPVLLETPTLISTPTSVSTEIQVSSQATNLPQTGFEVSALASPVEKILPVPYIDQVYTEYETFHVQKKGGWNWCGSVSTAMVLKYFGADTRGDVSVSYDAWKVIYDPVGGNLRDRIPVYTERFGVKTNINKYIPSFVNIKKEIDAGRPIIYHNSLGVGHFFVIVGYREYAGANESSQEVIVQDPYASYWGKDVVILDKNKNAVPQTQTNNQNKPYKMGYLSSIFRYDWESFTPNPAPKITSLSKSSIQAGSGNTPITITGSDFVKGAGIKWNGTLLDQKLVEFVSSTQVKVTIPADLLTSGTTANISVFNHLPGGGNSTNLIFTVNNPKPVTTNLSHRVIVQTGTDLMIIVTGSGFVPKSVVKLNNTELATTYVSTTQLTAVIKSALQKGVGVVTISVYSPIPAGGTSNVQMLVKADFNSQTSIISYHSKKALDLPGGLSNDSIKIQQWAWDRANSNQRWLLIPTGNLEEYWIVSPSTQKCLDISGWSQSNLANLIQYTCHFGNNQRFKRIKQGYGWLGTLSGKNYGYQNYYSFESVNSHKYLDIDNWSTKDGALVLQYTPGKKQGNQMWYVLTP